MAYKYREEIVGKRFLSVCGYSKLKLNKISGWGWRAGVIRAASHKDNTNKELQVSRYRQITRPVLQDQGFYIFFLFSYCVNR